MNRNLLAALLSTITVCGSAALAAPPPAALQGEWHYGSVSMIDYYNPATNGWTSGGGTSEILKIAPDGSYERTGLLEITTYGCTSKVFVHDKGTVRVEGNKITFQPGATNFSKGYTCTPSKIYEKQNAVQTKTYTWRVEQSNGYTNLSLDSTQYRLTTAPAAASSTPAATSTGAASSSAPSASKSTGVTAKTPPAAKQSAPAANTISGSVTLPAGMTASAVHVFACPVDSECDSDDVRFASLSVRGTAAYRLEDVRPGAYEVFAWVDENGNEEVDAGDLLGTFGSGLFKPSQVAAGTTGADISLTRVP